MKAQLVRYIKAIQDALDASLLKQGFNYDPQNPLAGHCYVASEALYHLAGGQDSPLRPVRAKDDEGIVHWWLEDGTGEIWDPTAEQYLSRGLKPPYDRGRRGGFLTKRASKRSLVVISRVARL